MFSPEAGFAAAVAGCLWIWTLWRALVGGFRRYSLTPGCLTGDIHPVGCTPRILLPYHSVSASRKLAPTPLDPSRREWMSKAGAACAVAASGSVSWAARPRCAEARQLLGLTSPVLEQIRISRQETFDNRTFSADDPSARRGAGATMDQPRSVVALVPIAAIEATLKDMRREIDDETRWPELKAILERPPFTTKDFKKTFNAFSDNIYYVDDSNPSTMRANVYLGGGATPSSTQTVQYLLRNEILTSVQDLTSELEYLIKASRAEDRDTTDAKYYLDGALKSLRSYLEIPPKEDVELARQATVTYTNPKSKLTGP